jgi:predicted 2-oxoglutarate/Fe(II)-dependent dioxygenase YbiX
MASQKSSDIGLKTVEGFFAADTCRMLVDEMQSAARSSALTYGRGLPAVDDRVRRVSSVTVSESSRTLVTSKLIDYLPALSHHFQVRLTACEEPQFLLYRVGDFFVAHQDGNTGLIQLDSDRFRRVSVSVFLNDQAEYEGGSLVFTDRRTGNKVEFEGRAGTLLAFRSETTHEITPVTRGARYSIVTWFGKT